MNEQSYNEQGYNAQFGMIRLILIVGFFIVAYMLYQLTVSIYDKWVIEQEITSFETKNEQLRDENQQKLEDFQYYTSEQYVEKIAKQNLGLINEGEKIIIIPDKDLVVLTEAEDSAAINEEFRATWSNPKKWWKFFFNYNQFKS